MPVAQHGRGEDASEAVCASKLDESRRRIPVMLDIGDIQQSRCRRHAAGEGDALRRRREEVPQRLHVDAFGAVEGVEVDQRAVVTEHEAGDAIAQAEGAGRDDVEHRLHVGLGAADDAQDLARRRLLLQSLAQRAFLILVRCPWRTSLVGVPERCTALPAILVACGIILLAPGTLHTAPSQRIGAGTGRTGGESLCRRTRRGQGACWSVTEVTGRFGFLLRRARWNARDQPNVGQPGHPLPGFSIHDLDKSFASGHSQRRRFPPINARLVGAEEAPSRVPQVLAANVPPGVRPG